MRLPIPRSEKLKANVRFNAKAPISVSQVLSSALKRYGLDDKIAQYNFVLKWEEIVGSEIAKRTKPEALKDGTLFVAVSDSVWANELSFHKPTILARLKRYVRESDKLKDIYFVVRG